LAGQDLAARRQARAGVEQAIALGHEKHLEDSAAVRLSDASPIRPERIMHELQQQLDEQSIVVADASYSSIWITHFLTALRPGMRFLTPRGLAGLGWGFPMAMGAKLANPAAEVYALVGDGGFGHVWSELETAARMGVKVTLIVINNGILGFQKHAENVKFGAHTSAVAFAPVNHTAIARACGCTGIRVEDPAQLADALAQARAASGSAL
ncbi:thiamine pyrophosphate-dependent enzyme, partial [Bordetella pertussis]